MPLTDRRKQASHSAGIASTSGQAQCPAMPCSETILSARELEVLGYTTKGFTAKEVAMLMDLSHFTVRTFVRRIYGKLEVTSKAEAIYEARSRGLLTD